MSVPLSRRHPSSRSACESPGLRLGAAASVVCPGWMAAAGPLNWQLRQLIDIALAHGHAITIYPHPTEVTATVVIHDQSIEDLIG
jgi:hypothetical protein